MSQSDSVVQAVGIRKSFGGVEVLHSVDLDAAGGSILALLGENGAGKSTLVKILAGAERPDAGTIRVGEEELNALTPPAARALGIRMIFQELMEARTLSVAENICLGQWPRRRGRVDWAEMRRQARKVLDDLGSANIDVRASIGTLPVGQRQLVEVARALVGHTRCLILDEPTAALSASETERLFGYLARLRASGVAIIYITHRLDEVKAIADRVQVLRDGSTVLVGSVADLDRDRLVAAMLGRTLDSAKRSAAASAGLVTDAPVLRLTDASSPRSFSGVSLDLRPHEITALYGQVGSGIGEVAEALYGARRLSAGTLEVGGVPVQLTGPPHAIRCGIGLLPGDRQREGAFMQRPVAQNLCAPSWSRLARHGWITSRDEARAYGRWHDRLQIRSRNDPNQLLATLSGGNQQKVLLGRWLEHEVKVLLLIEPTRGVDVGARQEIYRAIRDLTQRGVAVLVASSDHEEVEQLADRASVMVRGQITQRLAGDEITAGHLVAAAGGGDV